MSERTVLSSFYSQAEAESAAGQIQDMGIEVAKVEELHAYGADTQPRDAYTISGKVPSLSSLTLGANPSSRDVGILLSADPAAYSMSGDADASLGRNYLLTVVCPNKQVDSVVSLIKQCNGYT